MCESHVKEDFNTMHAYTVVCDWDHTLAHNYYINRVSLSQDYTPSKCFYAVFQYSAIKCDLGFEMSHYSLS